MIPSFYEVNNFYKYKVGINKAISKFLVCCSENNDEKLESL